MSLGSLVVFFLALVQYSLCHDATNAEDDPIRRFLNTDTDSPREIVKIRFPQELRSQTLGSSGMKIQIRAFGENVDLWLHPRDSFLISQDTPLFFASYAPDKPGNVSFHRNYGLMRSLGTIFEDPRHLASLVIGRDDSGRTTVNGRIGSKNLMVRSLPEGVVEEYESKKGSIPENDEEFFDSTYHVVSRTNGDSTEDHPFQARDALLRRTTDPSTSGIPDVIYPKILLVVDHSIYKAQAREDMYGFLEYLVAFANGLDLKYRSFEHPSFRLHVSAIVIADEPRATPYIDNVMLTENAFWSGKAILDAKSFFYEIRDSIPFETYDVAVTVTRLAFGVNNSASVAGLAWLGTVCNNAAEWKSVDAIALVRDDGGFFGIHVAAHELGHAFGMAHDMQQAPNCMYNNGFIMSFTPWYTTNSSTFSTCSLDDIQKLIDSNRYECMYDPPRVTPWNLPQVMPGLLQDIDKQCVNLGFLQSCNVSSVDVCVNLYCLDSYRECRETGTAALEGTRCNDKNDIMKRHCVYNRCVFV